MRTVSERGLRPKVVVDPEFGRVVQIVDRYGTYAGYDVTDDQIYDALMRETGKRFLDVDTRRESDDLFTATHKLQRSVAETGVRELTAERGLPVEERSEDMHELLKSRVMVGPREIRLTQRTEGGKR